MKKLLTCFAVSLTLLSCGDGDQKTTVTEKSHSPQVNYLQNRAPLEPRPYLELPLGTIRPEGWLKEQLQRMANGMTGKLDSIYPEVVGDRNGWLGGDGDGWERGPYWIDGLLPLAYILDDNALKEKVRPWIEWTLNNQAEDGYLGPVPFEKEPEYEPGLQRGPRKDWWPKMIMLKILKQYYGATGDKRVITTLTEYFKYQLKELPERPLDYLSFWANRRGGDNLQVVYWLYNITGDEFLLELGDIIHEQTFPWTGIFLGEDKSGDPGVPWSFGGVHYPFDSVEISRISLSKMGGIHTVNLAQGIKEPVIRYQKDTDEKYLRAVKKALRDIKKYHGQPQGMYGGDEPLHGNNPVRGIEFCSVSEMMFSLEAMTRITGDMEFADLLEKITYNALPTQASDDYMSRQYFQAANQVEISDRLDAAFETHNHQHTDFVFGTVTGYTCCTTNMHQSWPKFVQNLFYATKDGGVAALQYAPARVSLKVGDNVDLEVRETTGFPFRETVSFKLTLSETSAFPFHLRIPSWAENPVISVNGEVVGAPVNNQIAVIDREWRTGDEIVLKLPMKTKTSKWYEFSVAVERGPLVYALKIPHEKRKKDRDDGYREFFEFYPAGDWNYGLVEPELENPAENIEVVEHDWDGSYPWNLENAPLELRLKGVKADDWKAINGVPVMPGFWRNFKNVNTVEEISLIPYGCTTLRITEFPVYPVRE
ncbi:beta-L-arabinofuranosidase domain-containing protein [Sinomicrobium weinanense]|uniref:Glycoside hydrolase family 127 protein n=1 Tax=Sinomicrobium weinanense TaxID=2842200 RepID=A0A926Q320_9FLAO|nr:beta-L-arabinofuranosidase domain-containing protein [Sinomicrobium weinanense]MBC9797108.1 glycoside hydrolase family 127 protein [Sinomicrobium weinanense]MBU3124804.1 glycoside hydrolase family 127 protein [Sinomicrobium weinanense]